MDSLRRLSSLALLNTDSDAASKNWTLNTLFWSEKDFAADMICPRSSDVGLFLASLKEMFKISFFDGKELSRKQETITLVPFEPGAGLR